MPGKFALIIPCFNEVKRIDIHAFKNFIKISIFYASTGELAYENTFYGGDPVIDCPFSTNNFITRYGPFEYNAVVAWLSDIIANN